MPEAFLGVATDPAWIAVAIALIMLVLTIVEIFRRRK